MLETRFSKGSTLTGAEAFFTQVPGNGGVLSEGVGALTIDWVEKRIFKKNIAHSLDGLFLPYAPNGINTVVSGGSDVISSKFTGCWFVKYTDAGGARVGHVATPECNELWETIETRSDVTVICKFKPTSHVDAVAAYRASLKIGGNSGPEILGIITGDNRCFAIGAVRTKKGGITTLRVVEIAQV